MDSVRACIKEVGIIGIEVPDLAAEVDFLANLVGLQPVPDAPDRTHMQVDASHHKITVYGGTERRLRYVGFELHDGTAFDHALGLLRSYDIAVTLGSEAEARARHVSRFLEFTDPFGNPLCLHHGLEPAARPFQPTREIDIEEVGHFGLRITDLELARDFYIRKLGLWLSDEVIDVGFFLRHNDAHHTLALVKADTPGFWHYNFQMPDLDMVMRSWRLFEERGVKIVLGPGRHEPSRAVFLYFNDPFDFTWEFSFGVRRIAEGTPHRVVPLTKYLLDMWRGSKEEMTGNDLAALRLD